MLDYEEIICDRKKVAVFGKVIESRSPLFYFFEHYVRAVIVIRKASSISGYLKILLWGKLFVCNNQKLIPIMKAVSKAIRTTCSHPTAFQRRKNMSTSFDLRDNFDFSKDNRLKN